MTQHECGCRHFGPGPHDADLRHPNPRACEHAEMPDRRVAVAARAFLESHGWDTFTPASDLAVLELREALDSIVDPSL